MQYDTPVTAEDVNTALANDPNISTETRQQIEQILGTTPGGGTTQVSVGSFDGTVLQAPSDQPVELLIIAPPPPPVPGGPVLINIPVEVMQQASAYVFQTSENIRVVFNTVERVIVSGQGNDQITVNGDRNTTLEGSGGNDTLVTSGGNDSVSGGDGNDSVSTGAGSDTIVSGLGEDTIDGGQGRDVVVIAGNKSDYLVTLVDGELHVASEASTSVKSMLNNVEFVSFNNDKSIAVADDLAEAIVLRLYQGVLGRDAENAGAEYWINEVREDNTLLVDFAAKFLDSAEFKSQGAVTDEQFIEALYANALGRAVDAEGEQYFLDQLANGVDRARVTTDIVGSPEAASYIDGVIIIPGLI